MSRGTRLALLAEQLRQIDAALREEIPEGVTTDETRGAIFSCAAHLVERTTALAEALNNSPLITEDMSLRDVEAVLATSGLRISLVTLHGGKYTVSLAVEPAHQIDSVTTGARETDENLARAIEGARQAWCRWADYRRRQAQKGE